MSTAASRTDVRHRHPLRLPPGSVRALLALQIAGLMWLLIAVQLVPIPLYLYFLLALILVFFAAQGRSYDHEVGTRGPLGLPGPVYPIVIVAVSVAVVLWRGWDNWTEFKAFLTPTPEQLAGWPYYLGGITGGFVLGMILRVGPWREWPLFQNGLAWVSLLATLGLGLEIILRLFIFPNLREGLPTPIYWETLLTALTALYFGARS